MKLIVLTLFLTQSISAYGFSLDEPGDCLDFSVGDCTVAEDSIINEYDHMESDHECQELCRLYSSCLVFLHDGEKCFLLSADYRKGCGLVGAPTDSNVAECQDAVFESCGGFDDEDCEYLGEDTGLSPPNGQMTNPLMCQKMCKTLEHSGCNYWVYKDSDQSCKLLKSGDRVCTGISGPQAPPLETCTGPRTTHKPSSCSVGTEFMGNCYELVAQNAVWDVAAEHCSSRGGALASIPNGEVNAFLENLAGGVRTWVGGSDKGHEGVWVWPNGDRFTYTHWNAGEPNNDDINGDGGSENCLEINSPVSPTVDGHWNDKGCSYGWNYICQFPMTVNNE